MSRTRPEDALLVGPDDAETVYLLEAASDYEERLLRRWLDSSLGKTPRIVRIRSSRRRRGPGSVLPKITEAGQNPFLIPVRVVWMAPKKRGRRSVAWSDALKPGDPRDPRGLRARLIRWFQPSRVRLIASTGAYLYDLSEAYEESGEIDGLDQFITRRAWRTLDKAERTLRGNRYKIPRFVPEAILSRGEFTQSVQEVATETGISPDKAMATASRYLREIAATHSPYVIDLIANAIHSLYRQGYGRIRYSDAEVSKIAALGAEHPIVFLPSHRSNLDRLSLQFMLWENDLPPNHTAGGINLNFFPIGPLLRRTGVFFIRRSFKDNELYKVVLRSYIDYLIEKRFPLEWYMEGGRSRSGRLNPARFGLLNYVVDSKTRGKSDDVMLIPVSIAYDHIQDVPDYTREAQGRSKEEESISWLLKAIRSLRRRYGDIHIRFGDAVSVDETIGDVVGDDDPLELQKLAFEVMYRIGQVTPITPVSVVSIALLASRGKARTAEEITDQTRELYEFIDARGLPKTESLDLTTPEAVTSTLDWLAEHGNVSSHEAIDRRVFWLDETQMIRISYYRNMVVHFFVNRAIAEMALSDQVDDAARSVARAQDRMLQLRDLLKFEFYFPEKDEFLEEVSTDISVDVPNWESTFEISGPLAVLAEMGEPLAYWALLPFLDSYQIVGDELETMRGPFEEKRFLKACLDRARMYRIEERVFSGESASQVMFKAALALAKNRGLLDDTPGVEARRSEFAAEVRDARRLAAADL